MARGEKRKGQVAKSDLRASRERRNYKREEEWVEDKIRQWPRIEKVKKEQVGVVDGKRMG